MTEENVNVNYHKAMPQVVRAPDAVPPLPVFSQAVISKGHVYVSGNIGCAPGSQSLVEGGVQAQTVRTFILSSSSLFFFCHSACLGVDTAPHVLKDVFYVTVLYSTNASTDERLMRLHSCVSCV